MPQQRRRIGGATLLLIGVGLGLLIKSIKIGLIIGLILGVCAGGLLTSRRK